MNKIVLATKNRGKVHEYNDLCKGWKVEFLSLQDVGLEDLEIVEDGNTFMENALIKAKTVAQHCNYPVMADDSGLSIDAFNGEPGIHSARFLPHLDYKEKKQYIIKQMENLKGEERNAHFTCALVYIDKGNVIQGEGIVKGVIHREDIGEQGFGYDGIFFYEEDGMTFAQMEDQRKDEISHRGKALRLLEKKLKENKILL